MKRSDAEKKLLQIDNQPGTFLIREDEIHPEKYTLSIRGKEIVNHYRISKVDSSGYYLVPYTKFSSLEDLVKYYQRDSHGLCCRLTVSCPKEGSIKMNKWEIEICSIHIVKRLHVGEFSEVMEGLWNNTTPVAVKIFKTGTIPAQEFLAEAEVMKKLSHPKILQLYAVCTREEPIYIITELMTKGDLLNYLRTEGRHLKLPSLINIGAQIAHGMDYLGSQHYIHRNLAARNVLVGDGNIVKIGGLSLFENNDEYCTNKTASYRRTIKWTAPEAALYNHFTIKSDVWSFGILLYELVTYGRIPYPGMTNAEVLKIVQEGYRMPMPMVCPEPLYEIMLDCWRAEPEGRLTFEYLYYTLEDFFTINDL